MQIRQASLETVIHSTAQVVLIYLVSVLIVPWPAVSFGLLSVANMATVWMVLKILKDPHVTEKRFEDQFYQDRDDIRRSKIS